MKDLNKQIISKYLLKVRLDQNKKIFLFFLLGLIMIFTITIFENKPNSSNSKFYLDSIIPEGHVLVPIQLINADSLALIIGRNGVVDLFQTENGRKTKKIASKVKIVQATDELNSFAVLLKEQQSQKILNYETPFFAVVQNPSAKSKEIFQNGKTQIVINYQN